MLESMESITQQHPLGCGLACVAFVAGKNYADILTMTDTGQASKRGFYCRDLVRLLSELGLSYEWKYITPKLGGAIEKPGAIIYLKHSNFYPKGHFLARAPTGWMDPWINFSDYPDITKATSGFIQTLPYSPSYIVMSRF